MHVQEIKNYQFLISNPLFITLKIQSFNVIKNILKINEKNEIF